MNNINIYLISSLFIIIVYLYTQNIQLTTANQSQKYNLQRVPLFEVTNNESPEIIYSDYETESKNI